MSHLAQFLSDSKTKYLNDVKNAQGNKWTVVMGNEAGDLDSISSSLAWAWIQSEVNHKPTIALLQMDLEHLKLRTENLWALKLASINEPEKELLFLSDIKDIKPFPSNKVALVDHNRLGPYFKDTVQLPKVVAIVDHHEDEQLYKRGPDPRLIEPAGSCSSHIALLSPPQLPSDLATLLLCSILIDTNGLKAAPGGKALQVDFNAAERLALLSKLPGSELLSNPDEDGTKLPGVSGLKAIQDLSSTLRFKKQDVDHLSTQDLLRRDYKEYTNGADITVGMVTVPARLAKLTADTSLMVHIESWMRERNLDIFGILTTYLKEKGEKHRREMFWAFRGAKKQDFFGLLTKGLEENMILKTYDKNNKAMREAYEGDLLFKGYKQRNTKLTRKAIAPLVRKILASDTLYIQSQR